MAEIKHIYRLENFEFDNLKDAERFNEYLSIFRRLQLKELYLGYKNGINYRIYAKSEYNEKQMREIRYGLESKIDVSMYAKPEF